MCLHHSVPLLHTRRSQVALDHLATWGDWYHMQDSCSSPCGNLSYLTTADSFDHLTVMLYSAARFPCKNLRDLLERSLVSYHGGIYLILMKSMCACSFGSVL